MKDQGKTMPPASEKTLRNLGYPSGIGCRKCGCRASSVIDTTRRDGFVLRRRVCCHCGERVTTREEPIGGSQTSSPGMTPNK